MKKLSLILASAFAICTISFGAPIQTKQATKKTEKKSDKPMTTKKSGKSASAKKGGTTSTTKATKK